MLKKWADVNRNNRQCTASECIDINQLFLWRMGIDRWCTNDAAQIISTLCP